MFVYEKETFCLPLLPLLTVQLSSWYKSVIKINNTSFATLHEHAFLGMFFGVGSLGSTNEILMHFQRMNLLTGLL